MGLFGYEGEGLGWSGVENVLASGADIYSKLTGAKLVAGIQEKQIDANVAMEKERTKKVLYLGFGMLGVLLAIKLIKARGGLSV